MKTKAFLFAALLGVFAAGVMQAAEDTSSKVQVKFDHPESFSDIRDGFGSTQKGEQANLELIKDYVVKRATDRYLAERQKLEVTFTNIDLAGDFEPWHGASMDDVRIVKDIYPPRMDLHFRLSDSDGKVIKEGDRELRDLSFMMNLRLNTNDPIRYEKTLLDDWMNKDLRSDKKK